MSDKVTMTAAINQVFIEEEAMRNRKEQQRSACCSFLFILI